MTADEFIAWIAAQPATGPQELIAGEVVSAAPERSGHALMKGAIYRRMAEAVEAAGLGCTVYPDGMMVQVDDATIYGPDVLVRCGAPADPDTFLLHDPVIVVEVLSAAAQGVDTGNKLVDYFRLPSVMHYLVVRPGDGRVIHHWRGADGGINTRIHAGGAITLDPPGIVVGEFAATG